MNKVSINTNSFLQALLKTFDEIKSMQSVSKGPAYQDFSVYLSQINQHYLTKQISFIQRLLKPIKDVKSLSILEVGSGYGLNLLILKFLGFKDVKGIEVVKSINDNAKLFIETVKKYCDFDLSGCDSLHGDAQSTNFNNREFDIILSIETISHVPSLDRFLREVNRLLKLNSYLIISDGNNCSCPWHYKKQSRLWKEVREADLLKRLNFIKQKFPDVEPSVRASLALHTELLGKDDLVDAIKDILRTKKFPMNLYFEGYAPVYFETGIWDEFGFYPTQLITDIYKYGFKAEVDIYFGSARGFPFNFVEDIINSLPLVVKEKLKPNFIAYARKFEETKYLVSN